MRKGFLNENNYQDIYVLLLDDDEDILESLKTLIERNGYKCIATHKPDKALEFLKNNEPKINIFITDYLMIGTTGMDVVKDLRKFNKDVYVILLTGYANNMPWDYAIRNYEIDSYSEKDTSFKDLLLKLDIAMKNIIKYKHFSSNELKFEEKLKRAREQKNLTQDEVAEILGVKRNTVTGYETGKIRPSFEIIIKLGELYDVSYDYLLG